MDNEIKFAVACDVFCEVASSGDGYSPAEVSACFATIARALLFEDIDRATMAAIFDRARDMVLDEMQSLSDDKRRLDS